MRTRALTATLAATVAALILTGCGGDNTAGSPPGGTQPPGSEQHAADHDQADITFAQAMIPHHAQAIEMAQLAPERAQRPQVKDLAGRIAQAQGPEIETMTTWLRAWNAEIPRTGQDDRGHGGMDPGAMGQMPGMMDPQQMQQLDQATGAEFDRLFLQMMLRHHEGAIAMARTELADGQNPEARQLAQQIIDAQQAEIQEMQALLPPG
ncbi:MAG: DUF305 domain-containing protein [Pseudonocardiaceae bacterium]